MADPTPGPLVPKKYAVALAAAGVVLCAGARLLPPDFRDLGVVVSYLLCAAGGHEWRQPAWFKARPMVSQPVALAFGGMAAGAYDWAQASGTPLAHLLGLTLSAAAGVVTQPTVGLKNGATGRETLRLVPLLLLAGSLQGCATTRMLAEKPPEEVPHALAPGLVEDVSAEERAKECKHTYFWLFVTGIANDVAATFAAGAAGGAVLTDGEERKWFAVGGLGFVALEKSTGNAHTALAARYAELCRKK